MNILFVVPYTPTLIRVRPYNLIRFLARRGHQITLATVWENPSERQALDDWQTQGIETIAVPLSHARKLWNSLRALLTRTPLQAMYCWQPDLKSLISNLGTAREYAKSQFDVIHIEHLRGARYGLSLKSEIRNQKSEIPIVWDSVDCITYLFEQAARQSQSIQSRLITQLELGRTRRYEGWLVGQFDRVLVTSETDKAALQQISNLKFQISNPKSAIQNPQSKIAVLPNGVDLEYFAPGNQAREPDTLVFSGKMSYHANITAALYLANKVMPLVWARRPGVRLVIAGSRPTSSIRQLAIDHPAQVEVTGHVPDLRSPLQQASVAVAPLLYGAGIQNKVLEAMACGTPVVASPLAISALSCIRPGFDCLVADTPQTFAGEILRLLSDHALRQRLGAAGRSYVETHHNWDDIAAQLETIYQQSIQDVQPPASI